MNKVVRARTTWVKCERWLAIQPDPMLHNAKMTQEFEDKAEVLAFLKPWRTGKDLKSEDHSWEDAFNTPVSVMDQRLTTLKFASLFGTKWLSGSLMQMLFDHLTT